MSTAPTPAGPGDGATCVTAYATVARHPPADELAALDGVDAVVFASGSAVEAWVAVRGTAVPPVVVAIGPATERAARRIGVAVTHIAPSPGPAGVGAVLTTALRP